MAYGEPQTGGCECESDDEGNFNEDDLIKVLSNAGFNEKDRPSVQFEEHNESRIERNPEPTINGI
jgi:hypothetical protein